MKKLKQIWGILFSKRDECPYVIKHENTSDVVVTGILFGFNDYQGKGNWGNPESTIVTNVQGGSYGRLLHQSNNRLFTVHSMRILSHKCENLEQSLFVKHLDSEGVETTYPINLSLTTSDQISIDIVKKINFDANSFMQFTIEPQSYIIFHLYKLKDKPDYLGKIRNVWGKIKRKLKAIKTKLSQIKTKKYLTTGQQIWEKIKNWISIETKKTSLEKTLTSAPYVIQYKNDTDSEKDCVMFGFNEFFNMPNFGTDNAVEVLNLQGGGYGMILCESAFDPFKIINYRIYSDSDANLKQTLVFNHKHGSGVWTQVPIQLEKYLLNGNGAIEFVRPTSINHRTSIHFKLAPKSYMHFGLYPEQK